MDERRFDTLARGIAASGSRRGMLRALAGGVALLLLGRRAQGVSAQYGTLGPGDPCYDDSQCSPSAGGYSPLLCADNGFDYDGPFNCCTGEGGFCFSDEGCCGFASCINGSCTSTGSGPGGGDQCQFNDECFASGLVCDYVGETDDFRCCSYEGGSCGWNGQCCGWLTCGAGGYCGDAGPAPDGGLPLGAQCSYAAQCAGGGSYTDCANNGGFVPVCCLIAGQGCSADLDCCDTMGCYGGTCSYGAPSGCTGYWCNCTPDNPYACDGGLSCCNVGGSYVCADAEQCGFVTCSGVGCTCVGGAPGACDNGTMCCVQGDPGAIGTCLPVDACYVSMSACTDVGCSCAVHDPYACGPNLICCGPGEAGAIGTCQTLGNC